MLQENVDGSHKPLNKGYPYIIKIAQSAGAVEYADCISAEG